MRAADEFNRVVRQNEVPAEIPTVPLPEGVRAENRIRAGQAAGEDRAGRFGQRRRPQDQGRSSGDQRRAA